MRENVDKDLVRELATSITNNAINKIVTSFVNNLNSPQTQPSSSTPQLPNLFETFLNGSNNQSGVDLSSLLGSIINNIPSSETQNEEESENQDESENYASMMDQILNAVCNETSQNSVDKPLYPKPRKTCVKSNLSDHPFVRNPDIRTTEPIPSPIPPAQSESQSLKQKLTNKRDELELQIRELQAQIRELQTQHSDIDNTLCSLDRIYNLLK